PRSGAIAAPSKRRPIEGDLGWVSPQVQRRLDLPRCCSVGCKVVERVGGTALNPNRRAWRNARVDEQPVPHATGLMAVEALPRSVLARSRKLERRGHLVTRQRLLGEEHPLIVQVVVRAVGRRDQAFAGSKPHWKVQRFGLGDDAGALTGTKR